MELSPAVMHGSAGQQVATPANSHQHFYAWCMFALLAALFMEMTGTVAFTHVVLAPGRDHACAHLLLNLTSAIFAIVTLLAICVSEHRRKNDRAQMEMLRKLERESASGCRVIDQDTDTFTPAYFHQVLLREIGRSSISARTFCIARFALRHSGYSPQGQAVFSYFENVLAKILRSSLRASDVIARTAQGEFTIILPEINEHLAQIPLDRIRRAVERWNLNSGFQYRLRMSVGFCEYERTGKPEDLLMRLSQRSQFDQFATFTHSHGIPPAHLVRQTVAEDTTHVC